MDIAQLTARMNKFVQTKGWYEPGSSRPQTPSHLAQAMSVECSEVLELYAWGREPANEALASELADVALYLLQLASQAEIDLEQAVLDKLEINQKRTWDNE